MPIRNLRALLGTGEECHLSDYRGKVLLIVNVASKCGFTLQYKGLQALHEQFQPRGFEILAFPCNSAIRNRGQTQRSLPSAAIFIGVIFPLFAKIEVNGKNAHALYVWLKQQKGGLLGDSIK